MNPPVLTVVPASGVDVLAALLASAEEPQLVVTESALFEGVDTVEEAAPVITAMLTEERKTGVKRRYPRPLLRQQHIIAYMLVNPFATTTDICSFFGIVPQTLSTIASSDTFQSLIGQHRISLATSLGQDVQQQLRDTLSAAIEVTQKAVIEKQDPDYALQVMDKAANRLGLGARQGASVQINNNIVTADMIAQARSRRVVLPALPPND